MLESVLAMPAGSDGRVLFDDHAHPAWRDFEQPPHMHRFLEVHLITRGSGVVLFGTQRVRISAGTMYWVPPLLEHATFDTSATFRRYSLSIRTAAARRVLGKDLQALLKRRTAEALVARLETVEIDRTAKLLREVMMLGGQHAHVLNAGLGYALARMWSAFRGANTRSEITSVHPAVGHALQLLRGDGLRLSRAALAVEVEQSVSGLSRLFVKELGQTLRDVRSARRLAHAIDLLHTGACDNLTEAALEAGFGSYSQFHRTYRKRLGASPGEQLRGRRASGTGSRDG